VVCHVTPQERRVAALGRGQAQVEVDLGRRPLLATLLVGVELLAGAPELPEHGPEVPEHPGVAVPARQGPENLLGAGLVVGQEAGPGQLQADLPVVPELLQVPRQGVGSLHGAPGAEGLLGSSPDLLGFLGVHSWSL
jgi:hypothetical protein